jgi:NAD(P)-dependent dehydrogenase (short-subunit alcohol dehydrogenase family)
VPLRILITGASRGLGLEFARQYVERGEQVFAAARHPERADDLQHLAEAHKDGLHVVRIDVGDAASIAAAYREIDNVLDELDLLINNAGVYTQKSEHLGRLDFDDALEVMRTNAIAPLIVSQEFLPLLRKAKSAKVVSITSGYGSISHNSGGFPYYYAASKAALNMGMRSLAGDVKRDGITVLVLNPGWVRTDMGGPGASLSPEESVRGMIRVIDTAKIDRTGLFFNWKGQPQDW